MTDPTFTPCARKRSHDCGPSFGRMSAWVAYLQRPDGSLYLVSGLPHGAKPAAVAEAGRTLQAWQGRGV